jgi:hypothetical protein
MFYRFKLFLLRQPLGSYLWRYWQAWRGRNVGTYDDLPHYIRRYASQGSFADIGCMWGVNGLYSFIAEEAGATMVKAVDAFGPTPEFEAEADSRNSSVEFILGDVCSDDTLARIGVVDTVFCAGVLYHHPNPYEMLVALRRICRQTLILRTFAIPENRAMKNMAVFFPYMQEKDRKLWNLLRQGLVMQLGITNEFNPEDGYGNYFWGMTPGCIRSLLKLAGFTVLEQRTEPFAQTFICRVESDPFGHAMPDEDEAKKIGAEVSERKIARPA